MRRGLDQMARRTYDLLVIGGGINGAAIARDAALRGMKTALVEKEDFGYGTTSRSTRLIHGGLRYLELFDFGLVREGLVERERLLRLAPHLVRPLPFLLPMYAGDGRSPLVFRIGMLLYDLLAAGSSLPKHRRLSRTGALDAEPGLSAEGLRGAMRYYDAQVDLPERLTVSSARAADRAGADLANHAELIYLTKILDHADGVRWEAEIQDRVNGGTYTIRARTAVNAVGPWADHMVQGLLPSSRPRLRLTKGIHLVVPSFTRHAMVLFARQDDRLFFVIPWMGHSLVGTTDTDVSGDLDRQEATSEEIAYLIEGTRKAFPAADMREIHYTTAGVRPLVRKRGASATATAVSRVHEIRDHAPDGAPGLFSVLGGKITNHRRVAEETVDRVAEALRLSSRRRKASTRHTPYFGGDFEDAARLRSDILREYGDALAMSDAEVERILRLYGSEFREVLEPAACVPSTAERLVPNDPRSPRVAEVLHAVEHEMARSTADILLRRLPDGLSADQGRGLAPRVASLLAARLGWDSNRLREDLQAYDRTLAAMRPGPLAEQVDGREEKFDVG